MAQRRNLKRIGVSALTTLLLVAGSLSVPTAAHAAVSLEVGPSTLPVDGTLEIAGAGCPASSPVELYFWQTTGSPYKYEFTASQPDGSFAYSLALDGLWPNGVQIGIRASCGGSESEPRFVLTEQPSTLAVNVSFSRSAQRYGRSELATVSFDPATTLGMVSLSVDGKQLSAKYREDAVWSDPIDFVLPAKLKVGKRTIVATFRPSAPGAAPTVKTVKYTVKKALTKTSITLSKKRAKSSENVRAIIRVKAAGVEKPSGKITIRDGKKTLKTVTMRGYRKGKLSVVLPKIKRPGVHRITVRFHGSSTMTAESSAAKTLLVRAK
ncbi:Ig-like domain repeat protein [Leucobacter soli]|uniref:Bacterial Ig-like domain-containing protein n=1 Tax=Leucobacter soli TaxID=2812850 RepID=A0A916JQX3_9MICO|nr:Ig-like domain repeat protein [Leucobacter soli]CAG7594982.1 hypothetical protein LEUCIP111803_00019 [Leucobacter soli]